MAHFYLVVIALVFPVEMLLGAGHNDKAPAGSSKADLCQAVLTEIQNVETDQTPESTVVRILALKSWARFLAPSRKQMDQMFGKGKTLEDFNKDTKPFLEEKKKQVPNAVLEYLGRWDTEISYVKERISEAMEHKKVLKEDRKSIETKKGKVEGEALQKEVAKQNAIDDQEVSSRLDQELQSFKRRIKSYETDIDRVNALLKDADVKIEEYSDKLLLYGSLKDMLLDSYVREFDTQSDANKRLTITSADGSSSKVYDYPHLEVL